MVVTPRLLASSARVLLACAFVFTATVLLVSPKDQPFERTSVTTLDTLSQRSVRLFALGEDGSGVQCSAFLVGPDTVMTAAHCVRDRSEFLLYPSVIGSTESYPFGQCSATSASYHERVSPGVDDLDGLDYALVRIDTCDVTVLNPAGSGRVGDTIGWWELAAATNEQLESSRLVHLGYPGDDPSGKLWQLQGMPVQVGCGPVLSHLADLCSNNWQVVMSGTAPQGTSGGVLYADLGSGPVAVGVQNGYDARSNRAVFHRIDADVLADVSSWTADPRS